MSLDPEVARRLLESLQEAADTSAESDFDKKLEAEHQLVHVQPRPERAANPTQEAYIKALDEALAADGLYLPEEKTPDALRASPREECLHCVREFWLHQHPDFEEHWKHQVEAAARPETP